MKVSESKVGQWYKIVRNDGNVQYVLGADGGFVLYGSGFVIKTLDVVSIEPIDKVPTNFEKGYCTIDGEDCFPCVCNTNDRWNGWAQPMIPVEHKDLILNFYNVVDDGYLMQENKKTGDLEYLDMEYPTEKSTIYKVKYLGEEYYSFWGVGHTWDFITPEEFKEYNLKLYKK